MSLLSPCEVRKDYRRIPVPTHSSQVWKWRVWEFGSGGAEGTPPALRAVLRVFSRRQDAERGGSMSNRLMQSKFGPLRASFLCGFSTNSLTSSSFPVTYKSPHNCEESVLQLAPGSQNASFQNDRPNECARSDKTSFPSGLAIYKHWGTPSCRRLLGTLGSCRSAGRAACPVTVDRILTLGPPTEGLRSLLEQDNNNDNKSSALSKFGNASSPLGREIRGVNMAGAFDSVVRMRQIRLFGPEQDRHACSSSDPTLDVLMNEIGCWPWP